jgi:DNA-binding response OmpR family regulator
LVARVRALIRREPPPQRLVLTAGPLSVDILTRTVTHEGEPLDLTVKEFEVIECLMRFTGEIVSRETLAREVWKEARSTSLDNVIDVHITRLRRKIDTDRLPSFIHTVRGVGFTLRLTAEGEADA